MWINAYIFYLLPLVILCLVLIVAAHFRIHKHTSTVENRPTRPKAPGADYQTKCLEPRVEFQGFVSTWFSFNGVSSDSRKALLNTSEQHYISQRRRTLSRWSDNSGRSGREMWREKSGSRVSTSPQWLLSLFFLTFLERWVKLSQADCSGGKWEQGRLLCSECTQVLIDHRNQICSRRTAPFVTQSKSCESCGHHHLGLVNVTI